MQIEVIDDCSTDGDVEKLVNDIGKGRITYYRQETNRGSLRNFETCITRSRGDFIHLLHGDDMVQLGFYSEIAALFTKNPEAGAAFTHFFYIDQNSNKINIVNKTISNSPGIIPDFVYKIAIRQLIQPPAMVVKRSVYEDLGSFYAVHYGEDWEMWARIASKYAVAYSPKYLASYRIAHGIGISHHSFLTGQNIVDMRKVINIIQNYLPVKKRRKYKKAAHAYNAKSCVQIANSLLLENKQAAFLQARGAWELDKGFITSIWLLKFYLMYLTRYKYLKMFLGLDGK